MSYTDLGFISNGFIDRSEINVRAQIISDRPHVFGCVRVLATVIDYLIRFSCKTITDGHIRHDNIYLEMLEIYSFLFFGCYAFYFLNEQFLAIHSFIYIIIIIK